MSKNPMCLSITMQDLVFNEEPRYAGGDGDGGGLFKRIERYELDEIGIIQKFTEFKPI